MTIIDYKILCTDMENIADQTSIPSLQMYIDNVNTHLKNGYELCGDTIMTNVAGIRMPRITQAVVKYEKPKHGSQEYTIVWAYDQRYHSAPGRERYSLTKIFTMFEQKIKGLLLDKWELVGNIQCTGGSGSCLYSQALIKKQRLVIPTTTTDTDPY
jgi:hypothetical protein